MSTPRISQLSSFGSLGVGSLGEIAEGWNLLPGRTDVQRALPTTDATKKLGQNFSAALNTALLSRGISGTVQTDGVVSLFHTEMFAKLLVMPGVKSAFPKVTMAGLTGNQALDELVTTPGLLADITDRLNFIANGSEEEKSFIVPLVIGGGILVLILAARR